MGHKSPIDASALGHHAPLAPARSFSVTLFDGRLRIVLSLIFAIVVVSLSNFTPLVLALGFAFLLFLSSRLPFRETLIKIAMMDTFVLFLIVMLPFTTPGEPIYHLFDFPLTKEGFEKAALIALKTNAIVMMLLALVATLAPQTLGAALNSLKMPRNLVHLILFSVRYIDVLKLEYKRLRNSMRTRCFQPKNSLHTYRSIGYLVGMLIIRSLERSERILQAMKCRGFCGKFYIRDEFALKGRDYIGAVVFVVFCLSLIFMELYDVSAY